MRKVQKAIAIYDAKIQFVSLVDKAANLKQFLVTKRADGEARFSTYSKILKIDDATHYITGIVYEPMAEDAHGNYMTEDEIRKAAYWFAKNGDKVDLQHSFETADGLSVVENYVAPCDMAIGDQPVMKGTWIITVECSNDAVWEAVQKGILTGFSMGGIGKYSEEDIALENVTKAGGATDVAEKKSLLKRLGAFFGIDLVEKGEVMERYQASSKQDRFWDAMWALEDVLYRYNWTTDRYEFAADEATIRDALCYICLHRSHEPNAAGPGAARFIRYCLRFVCRRTYGYCYRENAADGSERISKRLLQWQGLLWILWRFGACWLSRHIKLKLH